jgi:hypothetical protein
MSVKCFACRNNLKVDTPEFSSEKKIRRHFQAHSDDSYHTTDLMKLMIDALNETEERDANEKGKPNGEVFEVVIRREGNRFFAKDMELDIESPGETRAESLINLGQNLKSWE